jgi:hypothetical protein
LGQSAGVCGFQGARMTPVNSSGILHSRSPRRDRYRVRRASLPQTSSAGAAGVHGLASRGTGLPSECGDTVDR